VPAPYEQEVDPIDEAVRDESPFTGSREVMQRYHKWHVKSHWNAMPISSYLVLKQLVSNSRGGETLYKIPIVEGRARRGTKTGVPTLSGSHAAGTRSLTITGGGGTFAAGDWIWLSLATDVPYAYLLTSSEVAGVIGITPGLRGLHVNSNVHHIGETSEILDTMELATPAPSLGRVSIHPTPRYSLPLSLEFVTALRRNP
jgi:hypothetical protein